MHHECLNTNLETLNPKPITLNPKFSVEAEAQWSAVEVHYECIMSV